MAVDTARERNRQRSSTIPGDSPMNIVIRREMLRGVAGALLFSAAGVDVLLTPRQARAQGVAFRILTPQEVQVLEAVGETLALGAREQGVAHFIDQQCLVAPQEALLTLRLAGANPPFIEFYRAALAEVNRQSRSQHNAMFPALNGPDRHAFIDRMRLSALPDWNGPPQGLVYAVLRADAVDVVYGTVAGFERLAVPYMPHIPPAEGW